LPNTGHMPHACAVHPGADNVLKCLFEIFLFNDIDMLKRSQSAPKERLPRETALAKNKRTRVIQLSHVENGLFNLTESNVTHVCCRAYSLGGNIDRELLQAMLYKRTSARNLQAYSALLSVHDDQTKKRIYIFDWGGLVVCEDEDIEDEYVEYLIEDVVKPSVLLSSPDDDMEHDTLYIAFEQTPRPIIENDVIHLSSACYGQEEVYLAVVIALSQSLSLRKVETHFVQWCETQIHPLTETLASSGEVPKKEDTLALIGDLYNFIHRVNLLGPALDRPDDLPPNQVDLYNKVYEYLEVSDRLKVVHERFDIVKSQLELFRRNGEHNEAEYKERIIIMLVAICSVLAFFELYVKLK